MFYKIHNCNWSFENSDSFCIRFQHNISPCYLTCHLRYSIGPIKQCIFMCHIFSPFLWKHKCLSAQLPTILSLLSLSSIEDINNDVDWWEKKRHRRELNRWTVWIRNDRNKIMYSYSSFIFVFGIMMCGYLIRNTTHAQNSFCMVLGAIRFICTF